MFSASTDVHDRSMRYVRNGFPQNLMRDGSSIAFAEKKKAEDVCYRVSFLPLEIDMRHLSGDSLDLNQQGSNGIRHHGASGVENAMLLHPMALDGETLIELRSIGALHFKKSNWRMFGKPVILAHNCFDTVEIVAGRNRFRSTRNDPK